MPRPPVDVLWIARYDYQPHWKLKHHSHKHFQMICFRSGNGCFFLEDRQHRLAPGMVFLIKPGQVHGLSVASLVKTLDIKFVVNDAQLRRAVFAGPRFIVEDGTGVSGFFEHIRWEAEHQRPLFSEMCKAYLVQILITYLRQDHRQLKLTPSAAEDDGSFVESPAVSRKAIDFIHQHYAEDLKVWSMARALGVSDRHLRQRFKESVGMPPLRYLTRYRIERAKHLIMYSNDALKEIAEASGFKSVHHFSHLFFEMTGETPGAWRRRYQEGICKDFCINPHFSNVVWVAREEDHSVNVG